MQGLIQDERGVVASWLARVLVTLAVLGVLLFDAGAIAVNFFGLDSTAQDIAVAISTDTHGSGASEQQLTDEAAALATEAGAKVVKVEIDEGQKKVTVVLRRRADTLVAQRFGFTQEWTRATASGTSGTD